MEGHDFTYLLKMVQQVKLSSKNDSNGIQESSWDYIGAGEDCAMTFDIKEVVDLAVEGVLVGTQNKMQNGTISLILPYDDFRIDSSFRRSQYRIPY